MTVTRLLSILFLTLLATFPKVAIAVPSGATLMAGDSDAQVVLENGTIGVLYVRAVYEVQDSRGCKSLYVVAEEDSFKGLAQVAQAARSPLTISLDRPRMKVVVRPNGLAGSDILIGHVEPGGERVFVLTAHAADRWQ